MVRQAWLRRALDGLILILVVWLLAAAAYISLGRQFVPAVADYQAELVAKAEAMSGRAIVLDSLSGEMQGSQPVFTLRGLQVHAAADLDSPILFALDNVTARLDVFASLWRREPVLDALQIEGLELEVIEEVDGRWVLQGLGSQGGFDGDIDEVVDRLLSQRRITLLDTRIRISPHELPDWVFDRGDLTLFNKGARHRLDAQILLPDGETMRLQIRGQGRRSWTSMQFDFFAEIPALQWSDWVPSQLLEQARVNRVVAGGRYWGKWADGRLQRLQGELDMHELDLQSERPGPAISDVRGRFDLRMSEAQQTLRVEDFALSLDEQRWPASRLFALRDTEDERWELRADVLPLALVSALVPSHLPNDRAAEVLVELAPAGDLHGLRVQGDTRFTLDSLRFEAALDGVGFQPWQAVPGFQNISGTLSGGVHSGELQVRSENWGMHLPRLFPQAWQFDALRGELAWSWSEADGLRLVTPGMRLHGEEGVAAVSLDLNLPRPEDTATMDLQVELRNSDARFYERYLPTLAPAFNPALIEWFEASELSGSVPLARFSYQGSIERGAQLEERRLELQARLEGGRLNFQPGWPALEEVHGTLQLVNNDLVINEARARLWQTELTAVELATRRESPESPLMLHLQGGVSGPLEDGLRLMQETPLAGQTNNVLAGWTGQGRMDGSVQLAVPLQQGSEPQVHLDLKAAAQALAIPQLQASLTDVAGDFTYDHGIGLTGNGLAARFLGQQVTGSIDVVEGGQRLRVQGSHDVAALRSWPLLDAFPLSMVSGQSAWQAQMLLGQGAQQVQIESDLDGIALDLPGPLGKSADQAMPSTLTLALADAQQRWEISMGEDLRAMVHRSEDSLRGDVSYRRGPARVPRGEGLVIRGRLESIDLNEWQQWLEVYQPAQNDAAAAASPSASNVLVSRVNIIAERFQGFGFDLEDLALVAGRDDSGWEIDIQQADIAGQVSYPDDPAAPRLVALQRLRFPRAAPATDEALVDPVAKEDPLAEVIPSRLPPLDVQVNELFWGEDLVGEVGFKLRPATLGADISEIAVALRGGLALQGAMDWRETGRTRFLGNLNVADIGDVLRAWGYAPTLTSHRFAADTELEWPGSPAFFALKRASGQLQLKGSDGVVQSGDSADALRVFGLLNFNALTRRLRLDFSDVFAKGTAYDTLEADLTFVDGVMHTRQPLILDGPSAKIQLDGTLSLPQNSIDMGMLVTLPITNNLPLAAIIVGAPYLGGALFIADRLLGDRVSRFASVKYRVSGDWQQPTVEFDRAFGNKAALENQ